MNRLIAIAAALVAALPVPASAGTDPVAARKVLSDYASCIVRREPAVAKAWVLSGKFLSRGDSALGKLSQRECIDVQKTAMLRAGGIMMRGSLAQALFDRDQAVLTATDFAAAPALYWDEPSAVATTGKDGKPLPQAAIEAQTRAVSSKSAEIQLARLGECVVRANAAGSRAVLTSAAATSAELDALKALTPQLSTCVPTGQTVAFDRVTLRGALALAYYRLATAVSGSAG